MTEKQITNPQRSAEEIARERILTCETNRDDGHALSQFALDDLVLCRAFLALRGENERLRNRCDKADALLAECATNEAAMKFMEGMERP